MSDTSGGKVKRTVVFIILIIFAVMTPAWSETPVRYNALFNYELDLYKPYQSFGFYEDADGTVLIGTGTVNGVYQIGQKGTSEEPFEIKPDKQKNLPQYYYLIESNHKDTTFSFDLTVSPFVHKDNSSIELEYDIYIFDKDSIDKVVGTQHIDKTAIMKLDTTYMNVSSSSKHEIFGMAFYYVFDKNVLNMLAEGDYVSTVKMGVNVNE